MDTLEFIGAALKEDVGSGDYSSLACIPPGADGRAVLKIKEDGIIAGLHLAEAIFHFLEPSAAFIFYKKDGDSISKGETAFEVAAKVHTILKAERLVLNCMQRMSGIATLTRKYVDAVKDYPVKNTGYPQNRPALPRLRKGSRARRRRPQPPNGPLWTW